jgi:hypothetical protein
VRERILCDPLPPPPPNVDTTPPDPDPNLTTRERFAIHSASSECAMCHRRIDGIGFGFETYDALGRYRAEENGIPIDASGSIFGARDESLSAPFNGAIELTTRLARSDQVRDCIATQWYRYAFGRIESEADTCSVRQAKSRFASEGGNLRELLVGLTLTDAFRYRPEGVQDP